MMMRGYRRRNNVLMLGWFLRGFGILKTRKRKGQVRGGLDGELGGEVVVF